MRLSTTPFSPLAILAAAMLCSCSDEPFATGTGALLRFDVSATGTWNTRPPQAAPVCADILTLRGPTDADTLFLHALVAPGIDTLPTVSDGVSRATPLPDNRFHDSFGVLTYVYSGEWSEENCRPDYMYNIGVKKSDNWGTSYFWPGKGRKVRFFAYAPYQSKGVALPPLESPGTPCLTYTVPTAVADQNDLLAASSDEFEGDSEAAVRLGFDHLLTAVRFVAGDNMLPGKVTKISLRNVYGRGEYSFADKTWSALAAPSTFSQTLNVAVNGASGAPIASGASTFMMLPQTLPAGASIEVEFTDNLSGTKRLLTASIGGAEWGMGKTVTYHISTSSIVVTNVFELNINPDFKDWDYNIEYKAVGRIESHTIVSRVGDETKSIPLKWKLETVESDGNGGYTVINRPNWIQSLAETATGAYNFACRLTSIKDYVNIDAHNEVLKSATPVQGCYNLSNPTGEAAVLNTANCYIVNAPGTYSFPLVYGNAIKNGTDNKGAYTSTLSSNALKKFKNHRDAAITSPYIYENSGCEPADAVLVWQDAENLVADVALTDGGHNITFRVDAATIRQGNAVIAVRDASGTIMWSWHIWVTDYVPRLEPTADFYDPTVTQRDKVVTNHEGKQFVMMPVNVGWCDGVTSVWSPRSVLLRFTQIDTGKTIFFTIRQNGHTKLQPGNATYYQFGRKDPMLPADKDGNNKNYWSGGNYEFSMETTAASLGTSIMNPFTMYVYSSSGNKGWYEEPDNIRNFWSAENNERYSKTSMLNSEIGVKTVYDPSPVGYQVPPSGAFTGFVYISNSKYYYSGAEFYGKNFNTPFKYESYYVNDFTTYSGWELYCHNMPTEGQFDSSDGTIFIPAVYCRQNNSSVSNIGKTVFCINSDFVNTNLYRAFLGDHTVIGPMSNTSMDRATPVRPVREPASTQ